mmetsp:Transcript_14448/g.22021  ORF Transcript_14448/g.22021 Transcript_14448/m.22021 type:complete len:82 (+) Transcript_14448:183-428(+)
MIPDANDHKFCPVVTWIGLGVEPLDPLYYQPYVEPVVFVIFPHNKPKSYSVFFNQVVVSRSHQSNPVLSQEIMQEKREEVL